MSRAWPVEGIAPEGTLGDNARRILAVRIAEFYSYAPIVANEAATEELHNLRIAAKRLRYTLELFRAVFGLSVPFQPRRPRGPPTVAMAAVAKRAGLGELYINQFIKYAGIPILSLESATLHPLQSLTDIITITETFKEKRRPKIVLTWAPHVKVLPQCVANSFSQWINAWGHADFVITHPEDYELDPQFTKGASITHDQNYALSKADFVYVKNWSTYQDYGRIYCNDPGWMLTSEKLMLTNHAKVMHCLPVRRNVELGDEVLDGFSSIVTQQAANRVWAAQAVLGKMLTSMKR